MSIRRAKLARQIPIFRGGGFVKKVKLGEICEIITGSTPKSNNPNYWNGEYKWITPAEISDDDFIVFDTQRKITKLGIEKTGLKSFPKGTVLLSSRAPIGKVAISGCEMYCNQGFKNFICSNKINNEYLYYFLKSKKNYLNILGRGATFKEISKSIVSNIDIFLPTYDIQRKKVKVLKKIDKLIDTRKEQLIEFKYLVKSRFNEMFGDIFDTTFPIYRLEELCEFIKDGTHQTPQYTDDRTNGFKFLSSKDVTSGKISWDNIKYITESLHNELYSKISPRRNDILLAKNGTTGIAALVDCDEIFDIYVSLAILRFYDGNNPTYLLYAINSDFTKWQFESKIKGVGVPNLHLGEIRKTKIPLPPLSLQNEFADFVAQVDKSQLAIQKSLEELETLKKSLMQEYFG